MSVDSDTSQSEPTGSFDRVTGSDGGTIFMIGEAISLLCAILYYKFLPPGSKNTNTRHIVTILVGLGIGTFCFGRLTESFKSVIALTVGVGMGRGGVG